jgi:hypothetical protein
MMTLDINDGDCASLALLLEEHWLEFVDICGDPDIAERIRAELRRAAGFEEDAS